jgi:hypothetical protein
MPQIKFEETSPDALKSLIMYMYTVTVLAITISFYSVCGFFRVKNH